MALNRMRSLKGKCPRMLGNQRLLRSRWKNKKRLWSRLQRGKKLIKRAKRRKVNRWNKKKKKSVQMGLIS